MVPPLSRDLSSRATHRRTWLVSHAQNACIDASDEGGPINLWHGFAVQFEPTARACAHLPRPPRFRARDRAPPYWGGVRRERRPTTPRSALGSEWVESKGP